MLELPTTETNLQHNALSYLNNLYEANLPVETIEVATQAINVYLNHLSSIPNGLQFSYPATINPYLTKASGADKVLIAGWEKDHEKHAKSFVKQIASRVLNKEGGLDFITGSMYASKTDVMLKVIQRLVDRKWNNNVHAFIANSMQEHKIVSRVGNRPDSPLIITRKIPATPVNAQQLLSSLNERSFAAGDVILVEEISFVSFDLQEATEIWSKLIALSNNGVTVIATGLNTDFRAIELPVYATCLPEHKLYCNAFYSYEDENSQVQSGGGVSNKQIQQPTYTTRYDMISKFPDLLMPIPIGRVHSSLVNYRAVPDFAHPFLIIKKHNPDLYQKLLSVGQSQQLFNYNKEKAGLV